MKIIKTTHGYIYMFLIHICIISLLFFSCGVERETIPIPLIVTRDIPIEIGGDLSDLDDYDFHDVADFFGVELHMQRTDSDRISSFTIGAWNSEVDSNNNKNFITDVSLEVTYYSPMPRDQDPTQFLQKLHQELGYESFYVVENADYYERIGETVNDFTVGHYWYVRNTDFAIRLYFNIDTSTVLPPKITTLADQDGALGIDAGPVLPVNLIKGYWIDVAKFKHDSRRNVQLTKTW